MEISKNGNMPTAVMANISYVRDDFANGRRRYKAYLITTASGQNPCVQGEATLEVPNLEFAKILHVAMGEMLAKQPPEITVVGKP